MTIRAVLRNGTIQPIEPLPADWAEGQELVVEEPLQPADAESLQEWAREIEAGAAKIPSEDHERFRSALDEVERESKEVTRREWGTS